MDLSQQKTWLKNYQCAIMLTFDFDAESDEMRTAPQKMGPISKGKYGAQVGLQRIFKVLDEFDVPATFFVPGWVAENYQDQIKEIQSRHYEVAGHGYMHEKVSELSGEEEERLVLQKCFESIHRSTNNNEIGYRAPWFDLSTRSEKLLSELGFAYDSSLMQQDLPYFLGETVDSKSLVELPVEWVLDDYPAFEVRGRSPREVLEIWKAEFDALYAEGSFFNLTMHPECIGRPSRIEMLRDFVRHVKSKRNIWFTSGLELSKWWRKSHTT